MGAWGYNSFENDSALDWIDSLNKDNCAASIILTLKKIIDDKEYRDEEDCSSAMAAAEIIAYLHGKKSNDFPSNIDFIDQCDVKAIDDLRKIAIRAINIILEDSELKDLWEGEDDGYLTWKNSVEDLIKRLA